MLFIWTIQSSWHLTHSTSLQILISKKKSIVCINVLKGFYGQPQQSAFNNETNASNPVSDKTQLNDNIIRSFFTDFYDKVTQKGELNNLKIGKLVHEKKLKPKNIAQFKLENQISPETVYAGLMKERVQ